MPRKIFYHCTTPERARTILADGFRDREGDFGFRDDEDNPVFLRGVWVSDRPLDISEFGGSPKATVVLKVSVRIDKDQLDYFEAKEEGRSYREWCFPADLLNRGSVRLVES